MDPHEFARQQGQVIGSDPGQNDEPYNANDLMDMLLELFTVEGHTDSLTPKAHEAVVQFAKYCNNYLARHRVVSTGIVDGSFSLVFQNGYAVPLASETEVAPARPDATIPITRPQDSRMKGMNVVDSSVPVTTGNVGSPVRKSQS